ncbi:hypothetical protein ACIODS_13195 [Micromonospora chalcea]|uniref:hypothetical protein n=1 Tax=Micromonospora chalcea TaxID=1874 RepID=UPI00381445E7
MSHRIRSSWPSEATGAAPPDQGTPNPLTGEDVAQPDGDHLPETAADASATP